MHSKFKASEIIWVSQIRLDWFYKKKKKWTQSLVGSERSRILGLLGKGLDMVKTHCIKILKELIKN